MGEGSQEETYRKCACVFKVPQKMPQNILSENKDTFDVMRQIRVAIVIAQC